jgi:hypothetical protein
MTYEFSQYRIYPSYYSPEYYSVRVVFRPILLGPSHIYNIYWNGVLHSSGYFLTYFGGVDGAGTDIITLRHNEEPFTFEVVEAT